MGVAEGRNLLIEDDLTLPWKAAANTRKLLTEDKAVLMLNASLSITYAPVIAEAKNACVPLIFAGSVCPKNVYPPATEDAFCTTALAATYDSRAALSFVKEAAAEPVKIAFVAMAIPLSRMEIDFAAGEAPRLGMTVIYKEGILPPTEDYTPFANGIQDACANWVYSWAPWVTQIRTYESAGRVRTSPGRIRKPKPSLSASKTRSSMSSAPMRCSPTRCRSRRRSLRR